jgi:mono/diheme cytochrome c family protein
MTWKKRILLALLALVLLVPSVILILGQWRLSRTYTTQPVNIVRDDTPEGIARGRNIFANFCAGCHLPAGQDRAIGQRLVEVPARFGEFYSANLTSHNTKGIGRYSDPQLARLLRYGINAGDHVSIFMSQMSAYIADEDIAAIMGFLRSESPELAPDEHQAGVDRISLFGTFFMGLSSPIDLNRPASIKRPQSNPEYGQYLANHVFDCIGCHTTSFAGGQQLEDPTGAPIYSANITFHQTGIAGWTAENFATAIRKGVTPDSHLMRAPMPRFTLTDGDVLAVYEYLKTVPPVDRARKGERGPTVLEAELAAAPADQLVQRLGCVNCHGSGRPFESRWQSLDQKSAADLAKWIRDPQAIKPGTLMPNFGAIMSEPIALRIAEWLKAGRPANSPVSKVGA